MIDNKYLAESTLSYLRSLTYETMVGIFNTHCSDCPFRIVKLVSDWGHEEKDCSQMDYDTVLRNLSEDNSAFIQRGCSFGGEEFSLREIMLNTCRFWRTSSIEGGDNEDNNPNSFSEYKGVER